MDCTIFTIWNKKSIFNDFLDDLQKQIKVTYQFISIDNSNGQYTGARQAFQKAIFENEILSDLVVFMHPDIRFLESSSLAEIIKSVKSLDDFGIVGVAGCKAGREWNIYSNIINGEKKVRPGKSITTAVEVQTVDECMFIMKKEYLKKQPFSNLPGWHLYAVEQCIASNRVGYFNYVVPANLWHLSAGNSLDKTYMDTLERILEEIRNKKDDITELNTTVKQWKTRGVFAMIYRVYYRYKQKLKRFLIKRVIFYAF